MATKPETLEDGGKLTLVRLLELHRNHSCTFIETKMTYQKISGRCRRFRSKPDHCDGCVADYIRKNWEELNGNEAPRKVSVSVMVLEKMESPEYLYAFVNIYNELLLIPKNELDGLETKYIRYDKAKELLND